MSLGNKKPVLKTDYTVLLRFIKKTLNFGWTTLEEFVILRVHSNSIKRITLQFF